MLVEMLWGVACHGLAARQAVGHDVRCLDHGMFVLLGSSAVAEPLRHNVRASLAGHRRERPVPVAVATPTTSASSPAEGHLALKLVQASEREASRGPGK